MGSTLVLDNGTLQLGMIPSLGGCLQYLRRKVNGRSLPVLREGNARSGDFADQGSWTMFPYPGRLEDTEGSYTFRERDYRVDNGLEYGIHGFACARPWTVVRSNREQAVLTFDTDEFPELVPGQFPGHCRLTVTRTLDGDTLRSRFLLKNTGDTTIPAAVGDHPFWQLSPAGVRNERPSLTFSAVGIHAKENGILLPRANMQFVPKRLDFSGGRQLVFQLDHAYCNTSRQVLIHWSKSGLRGMLTLCPAMRHLVIYSPDEGRFSGSVAIEPQTCAPNAWGLHSRQVAVSATGYRELQPGEEFAAAWEIKLEAV
jgi:aldose 1-epimerase